MKSKIVALFVVLMFGMGLSVRAELVSLGDKQVKISAGTMGDFDFEYPSLEGKTPDANQKVLAATVSGNTATVKYDKGAEATVTVSGGEVTFSFQNVSGIKSTRYNMMIPFSYQQGGKWKMGSGEPTAFPLDKTNNPHLYQNHAPSFTLINYDNTAFTIAVPEFSYLELTDNRAWNWAIFAWQCHVPFNSDNPVQKFTISNGMGAGAAPAVAAEPGAPKPHLVDEIGQLATRDWPGKVKSVDEIKADATTEGAYYASFTPPTFDPFGGLPDSGAKMGLQKTGFFHVEKKGDKWALVDPAGNIFFHLGICAFAPGDDYTLVKGRESAFAWLPPTDGEFKTAYLQNGVPGVISFHTANMIRKYGKPYNLDDFQSMMIDRVRKWGFNSIGAFSPVADTVVQAKSFPYVSSIPLGPWGALKMIPGITNTWDPFDPASVALIEKSFSESLPKHADDPLLIGYFLTNEPIYEDIPKVVPTLKGSSHACKAELVKELQAKYQTIDAFNKAWGVSAASFDALNDMPLAVSTKEASGDMHEFTGKFFETYFKLVADTFHKYDTHHMLIGNRLQPGTINNEQLCRIAGKYLDIMSFNYYTNGVDKDFLNRIYGWAGRPMFLSEFYWVGNKETGLAGGNDVGTQKDRGLAYRNYVEQSASLGYIVGIEWFTLVDQATTGRWFSGFTGERANSGIFGVTDRPYKDMVAEMAKTNYNIYNILDGTQAPYVYDNPLFQAGSNLKQVADAPHATGPITIDGTTKNWPGTPPIILSGKRVVFGADNGGTEGSFKICWDQNNLYFLVTVIDPTPLLNTQKPESLWNGDGVEFFLGAENLDQGGSLIFSDRHLIVGAAGPGKAPFYYGNSPDQYTADTQTLMETAVPWKALGVTDPKAGLEILFDIGINDSVDGKGRQHQIMWNGTDKNSGDRTHWGRIKLLE
jgi:hypothetical protein